MKEWEEEAGATGKAAQSLRKVSRHTSSPARAQASIVACQEQQGAHARDKTSLNGRGPVPSGGWTTGSHQKLSAT